MTGKEGWTPQRVLTLLAIAALSLGIAFIPQERLESLQGYGYLGIFLLCLLANATIVLPTPAFLVVMAMGAHFPPLGLGLAAGSGAALGELTGYLAGYNGQAIVPDNPTSRRLTEWVRKYGGLTIFLLAIVPGPIFDLGGIVAGALRMPVLNFLAWCWPGKIIRMTFVALLGGGLIEAFGWFN
ncbi:MAG: VTT domain-containing protein [Anaerolineales bacterium]|nr:VTT domain-containing protein [Anaerolineales bacterium]